MSALSVPPPNPDDILLHLNGAMHLVTALNLHLEEIQRITAPADDSAIINDWEDSAISSIFILAESSQDYVCDTYRELQRIRIILETLPPSPDVDAI